MDADYAKNGYIAPFYICRIRLESNSSREVLGEFQFPGDYAMRAGQNNGFGVYLSDNNIYFMLAEQRECIFLIIIYNTVFQSMI